MQNEILTAGVYKVMCYNTSDETAAGRYCSWLKTNEPFDKLAELENPLLNLVLKLLPCAVGASEYKIPARINIVPVRPACSIDDNV